MPSTSRVRTLLALGAVIALLPLHAVPVAAPNDAAGQVQLLDWLLSSEGGRYSLLVAEPFENTRPWRPRAASNPLATVSYVFRTPEGPAFEREKALVEAHATSDFRQSLFIHTSFEIPGRESFWVQPAEPIRLQGQLLRCTLWVHSNGYLHSLSLLFKNADGREVRVHAGSLHWTGWRRLDLQLPRSLFRRGRRATNRYQHELTGLLITSHPLAEPGDVALMLDQLLIVADTSEFRYPGFEQRDGW